MKQIEFFEIQNPCVGVCQNGPRGYCLGCFRSRDERQHWNLLEQDVKRQVIKACGQRKWRAQLKKNLQSGKVSDDPSEQSDLF